MTNYFKNVIDLSKHLRWSPSEVEKLPYWELQTYIKTLIDGAEKDTGQQTEHQATTQQMLDGQKNMMRNMQSNFKAPKMPKVKF